MIIPLLTIYAEQFGASPLGATLLISIYAGCQLVSGPLLGKASDRMGRKPLLVLSQIGTFLGFLLMARATSLWVLYVARVIDGATAGNISLAQAYISDNSDPKDRTKSFALIGIAFGVGFLIGPLLTAYLVKFGLSAPIYAASAMSFTSIICTLTLLPKETPKAPLAERDEGPAGKRLALFEWSEYAQYFRRPVFERSLGAGFLLHSWLLDVHLGLRLVRRTKVHLARAPLHPPRSRRGSDLRRRPRDHLAGRIDRQARQAIRRADLGFVGLHFADRRLHHSRTDQRSQMAGSRLDDLVVRQRRASPCTLEPRFAKRRPTRARSGARPEPISQLGRSDHRTDRGRHFDRPRTAHDVGMGSGGRCVHRATRRTVGLVARCSRGTRAASRLSGVSACSRLSRTRGEACTGGCSDRSGWNRSTDRRTRCRRHRSRSAQLPVHQGAGTSWEGKYAPLLHTLMNVHAAPRASAASPALL